MFVLARSAQWHCGRARGVAVGSDSDLKHVMCALCMRTTVTRVRMFPCARLGRALACFHVHARGIFVCLHVYACDSDVICCCATRLARARIPERRRAHLGEMLEDRALHRQTASRLHLKHFEAPPCTQIFCVNQALFVCTQWHLWSSGYDVSLTR